MARTGMVENVQTAIKFVEQGHVRVGTDVSLSIVFVFFFSFSFCLRSLDPPSLATRAARK